MPDRSRLLSAARGDTPADLILRHARVVNVFTGEIEPADIAIIDGLICGLGDGYAGREEIDLAGAYVAPGLIDAHVHIESSLCTPPQFATAVVPRGVTTVVADPHEIANVCGIAGVRYMIAASRGLPLSVLIMAPSCVPATDLGTAGAALGAADLAALRSDVHGLAEVMNFPGVIFGDAAVQAKLAAYDGRPIDGHCPGVTGKPLNAYVAAGIGSDHESITPAEAKEKLSRGLYLLIREATNARNLHTLLPLVTPQTNRRICFCTDDRVPADLLGVGGIDHMVREAIAFGIDPVDAFRLATLNTAEWFGLADRGAIAPGRRADLMVFDDLKKPTARMVFSQGKRVEDVDTWEAPDATAPAVDSSNAENPRLAPWRPGDTPGAVRGRVAVTIDADTFCIPCVTGFQPVSSSAEKTRVKNPCHAEVRVIGAIEGQLVTEPQIAEVPIVGGFLESNIAADVLKMVVLERHRGTGNVGRGFIRGFGLKRGAIAGTVAHDHHNLVVIGCDDASMAAAAKHVASLGGGLCVVDGGRVVASLPLPVAGLMSDRPIDEVRVAYDALLKAAADLGATAADPFMAMSFMALEVIPALKLTDRGLIDVTKFEIVSLYA